MQRTANLSISVVIPSYRGGGGLVELVRDVLRCNEPPHEVVVVVDDPDPAALEELSRLDGNGRLKLLVRGERRGKVSALNEAARAARGDVLVFLDDDVRVPDAKFFDKICEAMRSCDILDIKKVIVGRGLLSKLVYIEYTSYNFVSKLMARIAGRTIGINGAAFAVRREAFELVGGFRACVAEDLDFALRSFFRGLRFGYLDSTYVLNFAPRGWRHWFKQRKRWAVGLALWLRDNYRALLRAIKEVPHVVVPALILLMPSLLTLTVALALPGPLYYKATYVALLSLATALREALPVSAVLSATLLIKYTVATILLAVLTVAVGALQLAMAKLTGMKAHVHLIPAYLLLYQPVWLTILIAGMVRVYIFGSERVEDWVV